jgi:hypothetical protein
MRGNLKKWVAEKEHLRAAGPAEECTVKGKTTFLLHTAVGHLKIENNEKTLQYSGNRKFSRNKISAELLTVTGSSKLPVTMKLDPQYYVASSSG